MSESTKTPTEATPEVAEQPGPQTIQLYVCPRCHSWYGASGTEDLGEKHNIRSSMQNLANEGPARWGSSTGKRSVCQYCKAQGHVVERVLVKYVRLDAVVKQFDAAIEQHV